MVNSTTTTVQSSNIDRILLSYYDNNSSTTVVLNSALCEVTRKITSSFQGSRCRRGVLSRPTLVSKYTTQNGDIEPKVHLAASGRTDATGRGTVARFRPRRKASHLLNVSLLPFDSSVGVRGMSASPHIICLLCCAATHQTLFHPVISILRVRGSPVRALNHSRRKIRTRVGSGTVKTWAA